MLPNAKSFILQSRTETIVPILQSSTGLIHKMLKVLLVSPTDPDKPSNLRLLVGGENTYTRSLLENPPKGVSYVYYMEAVKAGQIEYVFLHKILGLLVKLRILPISAGTQCFKINSHFDLIHCHSYSIRVVDKTPPIVLSDSSSNYLFLRDYLGWPEWRIRIGFFLRRLLFKILGVVDPDANLKKAKKLIVFSSFAKKVHVKLGTNKNKIEVIYPGLAEQKLRKSQAKKIFVNILFIGIWFERKGGPLLVEAFKILQSKFPNLKLTIVGPIPKEIDITNLPIFQRDFIPREELLKVFFPQADIFVLVPPKAEGYGFVVEEAASFGIPAVVSRVYALGEIVEDGVTGFVITPANLNQLIQKLEILIKNQKLRIKMGEAAKKRFGEKFSIEKSNLQLLKVYKSLI